MGSFFLSVPRHSSNDSDTQDGTDQRGCLAMNKSSCAETFTPLFFFFSFTLEIKMRPFKVLGSLKVQREDSRNSSSNTIESGIAVHYRHWRHCSHGRVLTATRILWAGAQIIKDSSCYRGFGKQTVKQKASLHPLLDSQASWLPYPLFSFSPTTTPFCTNKSLRGKFYYTRSPGVGSYVQGPHRPAQVEPTCIKAFQPPPWEGWEGCCLQSCALAGTWQPAGLRACRMTPSWHWGSYHSKYKFSKFNF